MKPFFAFTLGLAGAGTAVALGAWAWRYFQRSRQKNPEELERQRRLEINRIGRITAGHIVDVLEPESGNPAPLLVVYKYEVAGVAYEAAQDVSAFPNTGRFSHSLIGQTASVKYDTKRPTNSIIACEEWRGVPGVEPGASESLSPTRRGA